MALKTAKSLVCLSAGSKEIQTVALLVVLKEMRLARLLGEMMA